MKSSGILLVTLFVFFSLHILRMDSIAQEEVRVENSYTDEIDLDNYPKVIDFLGQTDDPFGRLNPDAPLETKQFGQLVGVWEAIDTAWVDGEWKCCWRGVWAFKYAVDGFGIQDYYVQKKEDFPPPPRNIRRDTNLTLLRVFSPSEQKWNIARISNGGTESAGSNFATFIAVEKDGEIVMSSPGAIGRKRTRMVFYEIKSDSFKWRLDVSENGGKSWERRFLINGKRLRYKSKKKSA